jgi:hypoxanthine phosphoribosyltransferase
MTLRLSDPESFISSEDIALRVKELGRYFTQKFGNKEIVAITMMNGAKVFATDLIRAIDNPNILDDNMHASSYVGDQSSGSVSFHYDISIDIEGRHVLLIEDILDTGTTLSNVVPQLWSRKPKSISLACMFEKPSKRKEATDFKVDDMQIGMQIADKFILGYGLDWKDPDGISRYRGLPYVTVAEFVTKDGADWVVPGQVNLV